MGLPDLDVVRVKRWCTGRVPDAVRDQIRIECEVADRHLTIVECRPPWRFDFGPEWSRFPIAWLRYVQARREWTLYWRDRNLRWHRYDDLAPSRSVQVLLDELDSGRDPIFWG